MSHTGKKRAEAEQSLLNDDIGEVVDRASNKRVRHAEQQGDHVADVYRRLPQSLLQVASKDTSVETVVGSFCESFTKSLFSSASDKQRNKLLKAKGRSMSKVMAHSTTDAVIAARLHDKSLALSNPPAKESDVLSKRHGQIAAAQRRRLRDNNGTSLSASDKRRLKLHMICQGQDRESTKRLHSFSMFLPLHKLWCQYICEVLNISSSLHHHPQPTTFLPKLLKADFHGAFVTLIRSRGCASHIGQSGIIVKETESMVYIINEQGQLKRLPKRHSVFSFRLPAPSEKESLKPNVSTSSTQMAKKSSADSSYMIEIYGDQICLRASERVAKKFKNKPSIDL